MSDDPASRVPELLTITEAAELLRAPVATLRHWRHLGTGIGSFRLPVRRVFYGSDDLRRWSCRPAGRDAEVAARLGHLAAGTAPNRTGT